MVNNLIKTPLLAIFFTALLYLTGSFIPFSEAYMEILYESGFTAGLSDLAYLFGFALYLAVLMAVGYGSADKSGIKAVLLLSVPLIGGLGLRLPCSRCCIPAAPASWTEATLYGPHHYISCVRYWQWCCWFLTIRRRICLKKSRPNPIKSR